MTTETDAELTPEQIWNQESELREPTAKAADTPETEEEIVEETPATVPEKTGAPEAKADDDINAKILEKLEKLEARQRNVEGHIGGLKTSQQQLQQSMEQARKATPAGDAPTKTEVAAAAVNPQKWEELKKDFPEWAEATEELLKAHISGLKQPAGIDQAEFDRRLNERVSQATASMREELLDTELNGILPDWKSEVKTKAFADWLEAQPDSVKQLTTSTVGSDAAKVLRMFSAAKEADNSTKLQQERKDRLSKSGGLPSGVKTPKAKTIDDMTPEELWNYEVKKREAERVKRGF